MIKRTMLALFLLAALLAGCSSGPDYKIEVTKPLYFQKDKAMPFEMKVLENKKAVKGLKVSVELSMANMDHGSYKAKLTEGKAGTYAGNIQLEMPGKYEAAFTLEKGGEKTEKIINLDVKKPQGVASINGKWITNDDLAFYRFINQLQLEINRESAKKQYNGKQLEEELTYLKSQEKMLDDKNQLLTQIIRMRSMAMLAEEKGHKADPAKVEQQIQKVRNQYNQYTSAKKLIKEYGEEKFWAKERKQYQSIVLIQQVQEDLLAQAKKDNPKAGDQEVYYEAQQKYEDLLVSQVNSLKIVIL
ncbi:FixH family protein [Neobacillus cucumis]|uniref:FixH family protein n=1 Tax=Neobacillus cucumis TaxID=1740721 RepID=UPI0018E03DC5|nr:FixH family protein [Neobacillus cucumis]MBI0578188.1 FixH family protein [Neobacillus cucumis]